MSRSVTTLSALAILGLLAGCGAAPAASAGASAPGLEAQLRASRIAAGDAARARATQRTLNGLRARGHHNVRRPRRLASNG